MADHGCAEVQAAVDLQSVPVIFGHGVEEAVECGQGIRITVQGNAVCGRPWP